MSPTESINSNSNTINIDNLYWSIDSLIDPTVNLGNSREGETKRKVMREWIKLWWRWGGRKGEGGRKGGKEEEVIERGGEGGEEGTIGKRRVGKREL